MSPAVKPGAAADALADLRDLAAALDGSPLPPWADDLARNHPDPGVRAAALTQLAENAFLAARGSDLDHCFDLLAEADREYAVTELDPTLVPFRYQWLRARMFAVDRMEDRQDDTERAANAAYRFALHHEYDHGIRIGKTNLGLWAAVNGRPVEALLHFVDLFSIVAPDPRFDGYAHRGIARLLAGAGLYADSVTQFRLANECLGRVGIPLDHQVQVLVEMGMAAVAAGSFDEAVEIVAAIDDHLVEMSAVDYTSRSGPRLIEVRLAVAQGQPSRAFELFEANRQLFEDGSPVWHWHTGQIEAEVLLAIDRPEAALERLDRIPGLFPVQLAHHHLLLADINERMGRWEAAIDHLREAQEHRSTYVFDPGLFLGIGRTRLVDMEDEVAELTRATERAGRQIARRDLLLSHVAHEVRGPLSVLTSQLDLWRLEGKTPATAGEVLTSMVARIQTSLAAILDGPILDSDDIDRLAAEPVALDVLVAEVVALFEPAAAIKGSSIAWSQSMPFDVASVVADPIRLALSNVISNALKYSPPNSTIEVHCRGRSGVGGEGRAGTATLAVLDQGPGFAPEDFGKAFQPYTRLSAKPTAGESTTGVGLSLVKSVIENCGGSVSIENRPGGGAAVLLRLPVASPTDAEVPA